MLLLETLMREDAETRAHSTETHGAILTPALKFRKDPSIEFQILSNEEQDTKDHVVQKVCSTLGKDMTNVDKFQV